MRRLVGSRWMELPRKVAVGSGVVLELPEICADLKLEPRTLIVTGPHTDDVVGKAIFKMLEDGGFQPETLITSASKMEEVDRAERLAREIEAGFFIGAGGGRSIDIAKLASLRVDIPFLSVPTAASHDGICSAQASLTINGETASIPAQAPLAIVADTKIISQAPARLLAAGCGDIISNYTAILDWQLAHRLRNEEYSEYASALSGMTARMIVELAPDIRPGLEESAKIVVKALISSGVAMSIAGSSRPASGSEHKFAHAMNRIASGRALHGELCGLGTIMMMYLHGGDWEMIRSALGQVGAPTTASQLGLDAEQVIEALISAHKIRPDRYTILDSGLNSKAAASAAEATGII
ncbi:MAG: NAD(P)-dependent glycerol-1-phosphate dehydrogenase [Methanothrix sp.]|nr:NAD(P)-dependent glycerol-1-phosphate dehydrogenase [Methanothrix sp.]